MAICSEFWASIEARDWESLGALVSPEVVGTWPQSRERVVGRAALATFMAAYPGDWHLVVEVERVDATGGATQIAFSLDGETVPGLTFFTFDADGLIEAFTEFWPEPYEPPAGREHLIERY
jgi:SnoaL-like domain